MGTPVARSGLPPTFAEDTTTTTAAHDVPTTSERLEREFNTMMDMRREVKYEIAGLQNGLG